MRHFLLRMTLPLILNVLDWLYTFSVLFLVPIQPRSSFCTVFDDASSNIGQVLSVISSVILCALRLRFVIKDLSIYNGETNRPHELGAQTKMLVVLLGILIILLIIDFPISSKGRCCFSLLSLWLFFFWLEWFFWYQTCSMEGYF